MHINFPNAQGMGSTTMSFANGTSFQAIANVKNQIGVAIFCGTTGIEIAGIGASYAPATSSTLIGGVTTFFNYLNSNGSSLQLASNGNGLKVFNTILEPTSVFTGAPIWISGSGSITFSVYWFTSDAFGNQ